MSPRISVIVPTYDRPVQIRRSVTGLLGALGHCDAELIVIDDGSPVEVAGELAPLPDRVRVIRQTNAGPAAARNVGLEASTAEFVAFTDDDTVVSPTWLRELAEVLDSDPSIGAVGGAIRPADDGFLSWFVQLERFSDHSVAEDGEVIYLVTANAVARRAALDDVGGFDTSFAFAGEDVDLSLRLRQSGWRIVVVDGGVVTHEHRTSLRELLRLSYRGGRTRARLAVRHHAALRSVGVAEIPAALRSRLRRYRAADCSWPRAFAYLSLHLIMRVAFLAGTLKAGRGGGEPS